MLCVRVLKQFILHIQPYSHFVATET